MLSAPSEMFARISIIGLGFMGGSLGLAIKRTYPEREIVGVDREEKILSRAFERRAIDRSSLNLDGGVAGADLVVLATPISAILELLPTLSKWIASDTLVTDLGSTKARICQIAERCLSHRFIGGHPIGKTFCETTL